MQAKGDIEQLWESLKDSIWWHLSLLVIMMKHLAQNHESFDEVVQFVE